MTTAYRLKSAFADLWNISSDDNWIVGRLGWKTSATTYDLLVTGMPGTLYVSLGYNGDLARTTAYDAVGVLQEGWVLIKMRRENGKLVIRQASKYAGGSGGGGGASNLDALSDVTLTTPANGQTLQYNAATGQWINVVPPGGAGGAPSPHAHSSAHHTGFLPWAELDKTGSLLNEIQTRPHSMLTGIGANDHHAQAHVLATGTALGADHTISGAAAGEVLRASGPTTAAFDQLQHTDLGNVLPDQHHIRAHNIITGDVDGPVHTIVGAQWSVVGATALNTLGLMVATNAPGNTAALLRTDAVGGIQLDTNLFYADGANHWIGVNRTPSGAALDVIAAANADHTQRIKQRSGQTGRMWRIEDTSGNELIVLDSIGNLQSGNPGFTSGLTGWQITPQGNAEFNNIWARGELHATVFVKDEVHATGGSLLVATAGVLHDEADISAVAIDDDVLVVYSTPAGQGVPLQVVTTSAGFTGTELHVSAIINFLNINDPPSGPGFYFQPGDIIRSKTEVPTGVTDFWLEVNNVVQYSGYSSYSVTKRSGTDGKLPKGSAVVSYGKQGDGRIMLTSDLNYAPYIDVFSIGPQVWTANAGAIVPHVRIGRLDGVGLPGSHFAPGGVYHPGDGLPGITGDGSTPQYGMICGSDLSNANKGYLIASNLQFSLYKIDIRLNNGVTDTGLWTADGNLKIGSNIGATATTGFQVFTTGGRSGDVVIGNEATGNYLRWQQATGILQVSGSLVVSDPGTTVTKTYVDNQDAAYDNLAGGTYNSNGVLGGYALVAQNNAVNYGEGRRITGVTGTWTSPSANTIAWSLMTATFTNGGNRSIAAGNTGSISARTYLYINIALSGTLTMIPLTTPAVSQPTYVLIAVCDPGDPAVPVNARKASVTVVAGTTFISGANIFTGSITAANIAAFTITANEIFGNTITTAKLAPDVTGAISTADAKGAQGIADASAANTKAQQGVDDAAAALTKAQQGVDDAAAASAAAANNLTYSENRRVVGVTGTWNVINGNTINWSNLVVKFAGTSVARTIAPSVGNVTFSPAGRWYLYINVTGTGTITMEAPVQTLGPIDQNYALIAVVDTSAVMASIAVVAGSTYISGGNIMTQSIVTGNLAVGAVTADRIFGANLAAIRTTTGALTVDNIITMGTNGNIQTSGKTSYADTTAGVFLGYDPSGVAGYKFGVGDNLNYIRWGGTGLPLEIRSVGGINVASPGTASASMTFISGIGNITLRHVADTIRPSRIKVDGPWAFDWELYANKLVNSGDTFWMPTERTSITHYNSLGITGEIAWEYDGTGALWLYLCYATNSWRRILFPTTSW